MELNLPIEHPLAQALLDMSGQFDPETWLLLKTGDRTQFRSHVTRWRVVKTDEHDIVQVGFESQDEYVERLMRVRGL